MKIIDGKEILEDGETLSASVMLMDSGHSPVSGRQHKPGFAQTDETDLAKKQQAHQSYEISLTERWKMPPTGKEPAPKTKDAAIAAYDARISNAWKGAANA